MGWTWSNHRKDNQVFIKFLLEIQKKTDFLEEVVAYRRIILQWLRVLCCRTVISDGFLKPR